MPRKKDLLFILLLIQAFFGYPLFSQTNPVPVKVRTLTAKPGLAFTEVLYGARVEPADRIDIRAPLTGVVEDFYVKEGDPVKPGTLLFTIRRDVTGRSFQAVEVTAETSGRVSVLPFRRGDTVSEGAKVVTLLDDSSLKIVILVSDRDIKEIKLADRCDLLTGVELLKTAGRIIRIALEPDYATGLFEVELSVPKNQEIWIGRFLRVKLKKNLFQGIVVESSHLSRRYGKVFLQVVNSEMRMELREIETGSVYGQRTAVLSGIKPGEEYIIWSERRINGGEAVEIIK